MVFENWLLFLDYCCRYNLCLWIKVLKRNIDKGLFKYFIIVYLIIKFIAILCFKPNN